MSLFKVMLPPNSKGPSMHQQKFPVYPQANDLWRLFHVSQFIEVDHIQI